MPEAREAMLAVQRAVDGSCLEEELLELVRIRASQINGCAYCLDMHTKDARAIGVEEQRLHLLAAWREAPCYSSRERAALRWREAVTRLSETGAPDDAYEEVAAQFSPLEVVALTLAIVAINGWNRLAVSMRTAVGRYVSRRNREAVRPVTGAM